MNVFERIKLLRQLKGWTQEDMANKLEISLNSYGAIERGDTNVNLSRLQDISDALEVGIAELFNNEKNFINLGGILNNNQSNGCTINSCGVVETFQLKNELEKQQLIIEQQKKEIELLNQMVAILQKNV